MGEFSGWHWLIIMVFLGACLVPTVFYLLTLQRAFEAIDPPLRPMAPGLVWLMLVPLVNLVWVFFVVVHLRTGYAAMAAHGRLSGPTTAGYGVGLAYAICMASTIIPLVNLLTMVPALVLWIIHWVQVSGARGLVKTGPSRRVEPQMATS